MQDNLSVTSPSQMGGQPQVRRLSLASTTSRKAASVTEFKKLQAKKDKRAITPKVSEEERLASLKARMSKRLSGDANSSPRVFSPGSRGWEPGEVRAAMEQGGQERQSAFSRGKSMFGNDSFVTSSSSQRPLQEGPKKNCCISSVESLKKRLEPQCRRLNKNKLFQGVMFAALLAALFLPDVWIIANRPGNSDLDVVLTVVLGLFLLELTVQSIGLTRTYVRSFFFYMDIIGAFSLLLDLSYLGILSLVGGGDGDSMSNNVAIMRAARMAKLGARAGRFTRLVKLLRFLPGMGGQDDDQGTAKAISARLKTALSTRVSGLIIIMVMVMPFFSFWTFPDQDWSMTSWMDVLEKTIKEHPERLQEQLDKFGAFYEERTYYPYRLERKPDNASEVAVGLWESSRGSPVRSGNVLKYENAVLVCSFNFQSPNQVDSAMNVLLLVFIMGLMIGFSLVLSKAVSLIVLEPVEKLLLAVRNVASMIFKSVTEVTAKIEDDKRDEEEEDVEDSEASRGFGHETRLLERVVGKLGALSETMAKSNAPAAVDELGREKGEGGGAGDPEDSVNLPSMALQEGLFLEELFRVQREMVESAGLSVDLLNSWNLNPLELDQARNQAAVTFFLGLHNHGIAFGTECMHAFLEQAEESYSRKCAYHTWFHAVDVVHCCYRFLTLFDCASYMGGLERFSLLVAAVGHDLGHPGMNNAFLIETSHELALRYNDISPLESMHSARLFELLGDPRCDIFSLLSRQQCLELRQLIIPTILHTDNSKHFEMVKEVQTLYELNSEALDVGKEVYTTSKSEWPPPGVVECLRAPESRKLLLKLCLHTADISNPMKPFRVCRIWASQVFEEFFQQGDTEQRLGVPVQAMNDRGKVNRAFSQVGFIELMVSPLVFGALKILPPLEANAEMLVQNAKSWYDVWLKDTKPAPSEEDKEALFDRIEAMENRYMELLETVEEE